MENEQSSSNRNRMETEIQPQKISSSNNKLFVIIIASVLLTATISGLAVYFWQRSVNKKAINSLEQKITFLEDQISTMKNTNIAPQPTSSPDLPLLSTPESTENLKTYSNEKYGFGFTYPQSWSLETKYDSDDASVALSNIADGHTIRVQVYRVTGFGYCYKYGERKEIFVGGKVAETADGIGPSEMCDKPEEFSNRGNTFVLIPLEDKPEGLPTNQIHISYDYPLDNISIAKSNLDQILSTFKFTN